ncbi:hypothetical protein DFH07DRAFT_733522 [Mycena maculata]|uniref:Cyclin N-terminal domain-containing protein n=1 Tax=Mycena maculata TaxID=230809 RepID=A0AAD7NSI4_9AGAR|nr:hypothetical protein DFH07DRAFT_733522 [Mycena maculata]
MSSGSSSPSSYSTGSSATEYSSWSPSPSTKSTPSSPVHAASLVDPSLHSPELMELIDIKLTRPVIKYIVDCVSETVDYALGRSPESSPTRGRTSARSAYHTKFTSFVATVLSRAEVSSATVLVALLYIARARPHLSIALEEWALERVFLGALIVASKYTQDSTLKNVHWALCTGIFGKGDVGRMEREFLDVLDWELAVGEAELLAHHEALMSLESSSRHRHPAKAAVMEPRPRAHTHHRHSNVPELEPSSPQSSFGSMSPRTPVSHSMDPDPHSDEKRAMDVDVDVPATKDAHKLHEFLRAFHIPIPRPHSHQLHPAIQVAA